MTNVLISTAYTQRFVLASLPSHARRILEVGCGDGGLAERLMAEGADIVAIDADPMCVAAAQQRGLDARQAEWPAELGQFDTILFTRSLHHIHDLDRAVEAAIEALQPGGRIIVEDFRAEGGSARSDRWYRGMVRQLLESGALADSANAEALFEKLPPARHDGDELHSSPAIREALLHRLDVTCSDAAYYFRYLEPHLRQAGDAQGLLDVELKLIGGGEIDALGKRFVASRP